MSPIPSEPHRNGRDKDVLKKRAWVGIVAQGIDPLNERSKPSMDQLAEYQQFDHHVSKTTPFHLDNHRFAGQENNWPVN